MEKVSFCNKTARDIIILGGDNSLSSDTDNLKNDFLLLGQGPTCDINGSFGILEKNILNIHKYLMIKNKI